MTRILGSARLASFTARHIKIKRASNDNFKSQGRIFELCFELYSLSMARQCHERVRVTGLVNQTLRCNPLLGLNDPRWLL
jgi:hypothetical protein